MNQSSLRLLTQHNSRHQLFPYPLAFELENVPFNVATDGVVMVVVASDGTTWEHDSNESLLPVYHQSVPRLANGLFNSVSWRGTIDALLLKEMAGAANFMARPKTNILPNSSIQIDGSCFDPFYVARAMHWWEEPSAAFGRLIWNEGPPPDLPADELQEWLATHRSEPEYRALVLASTYMRVAFVPLDGEVNRTVEFPESAVIYHQFNGGRGTP